MFSAYYVNILTLLLALHLTDQETKAEGKAK